MERGWRGELKRYGAPAAFLAAVTLAVLLVRAGLSTDSSSSTTTVATTQANPAPPPPTTTTVRRRYYRLQLGETLSDVAVKFDTTVEELRTLNPGIDELNLMVGQRIRIR